MQLNLLDVPSRSVRSERNFVPLYGSQFSARLRPPTMPPFLEADRLRFAVGDVSVVSCAVRNARTFRSMQSSVSLERDNAENVAHFGTRSKRIFDCHFI
jgi:hypothetical protein